MKKLTQNSNAFFLIQITFLSGDTPKFDVATNSKRRKKKKTTTKNPNKQPITMLWQILLIWLTKHHDISSCQIWNWNNLTTPVNLLTQNGNIIWSTRQNYQSSYQIWKVLNQQPQWSCIHKIIVESCIYSGVRAIRDASFSTSCDI